MLVRELMTQTVEWTTADTTLATAARRMRDLNIGCLPVGDGDSFIGMLTEKDFTARATAEGLNPTTTTVSQIMSHAQAPWREHGEDGEHRTLPEVRTVARLQQPVGRSDGLHRYVTDCSGDWAGSSSGAAAPNTR